MNNLYIRGVVLALLCSIFLGITSTVHSDEAPLNLLSNGSYEEGAYLPTESPIDWAWDTWQLSAVFTWDDTQARTGDKSVKIYAPTPNDARWLQTVDIEPNSWYFLSGWIKTDNVGHTSEVVDAGANLSLFGTWEHSAGVFGSKDWTRSSILFNSGDDIQVTIGARLGYWAGTTTGTAWFDDLQLKKIIPMEPHPSWKILVLIYQETDFAVTDDAGIYHHYIASMTQDELEQAALAAKQFVEIDIPALTSKKMVPEVTIRFPDHALTRLSPIAQGWWPSPEDTALERDPLFDSVIVIWDTRAIDLTTGGYQWIGYGDGLAQPMGTGQTYLTMQIDAAISRGHRNVFKHEWGHSILFYFDAMGTTPKPTVSNHADATEYVNCQTGQFYVWEDETLANPIPNSIYNNESGFTHDYYSGNTATPDQPTRCLGISSDAWAYGGPVSHSGNISISTESVDLSGTVKTPVGQDICAMVLASGQYMFSCNQVGIFLLSGLPRENDGTVKRQIYADGFFPKINILADSMDEAVYMIRSGTCPSYNQPYDPGFFPGSAGKWIDISGSVKVGENDVPVCAMVLANGQHMFSCDGTGNYALNIPLDSNGQFKLQVYADSFAPAVQTFDEFQAMNDVRMARAAECQ